MQGPDLAVNVLRRHITAIDRGSTESLGCRMLFTEVEWVWGTSLTFKTLHLFVIYVVEHTWARGGQKTARRSHFSPSILWVLGMALRSPGLVASASIL